MVMTPWGDSASLKERKLAPGRRLGAEEVAQSQRERLFAAMVASVAERGYEATRVEDLLALAGVSRGHFYALFDDKQDCFLATLEAMIGLAVSVSTERVGEPGDWRAQAWRAFRTYASAITTHPAGARLVLVNAYAVGPEAVELVEAQAAAVEGLTERLLRESPQRVAMPAQMLRAFSGAMQEIGRSRLRRGREAEMPGAMEEMWKLLGRYRPPPSALREVAPSQDRGSESLEGHSVVERMLRAFNAVVAEQSYRETTVSDIVSRASISNSTFYSHFASKEDALMATIDAGGTQAVAAVLPQVRRAPDWASGIRVGFEALFSYLASRPALARVLAVEVYAAGADALERRARSIRRLDDALAEGSEIRPGTPAIATEAIAGGAYALAYDAIRKEGPHLLPTLTPICTYLALVAFIGADEACEVINRSSRMRAEDEAGAGELAEAP